MWVYLLSVGYLSFYIYNSLLFSKLVFSFDLSDLGASCLPLCRIIFSILQKWFSQNHIILHHSAVDPCHSLTALTLFAKSSFHILLLTHCLVKFFWCSTQITVFGIPSHFALCHFLFKKIEIGDNISKAQKNCRFSSKRCLSLTNAKFIPAPQLLSISWAACNELSLRLQLRQQIGKKYI